MRDEPELKADRQRHQSNSANPLCHAPAFQSDLRLRFTLFSLSTTSYVLNRRYVHRRKAPTFGRRVLEHPLRCLSNFDVTQEPNALQLGELRRIVDEVQWVFDLVGDAGGELAERGHLFGLDEIGLRGLRPLQRLAQRRERTAVLP